MEQESQAGTGGWWHVPFCPGPFYQGAPGPPAVCVSLPDTPRVAHPSTPAPMGSDDMWMSFASYSNTSLLVGLLELPRCGCGGPCTPSRVPLESGWLGCAEASPTPEKGHRKAVRPRLPLPACRHQTLSQARSFNSPSLHVLICKSEMTVSTS